LSNRLAGSVTNYDSGRWVIVIGTVTKKRGLKEDVQNRGKK